LTVELDKIEKGIIEEEKCFKQGMAKAIRLIILIRKRTISNMAIGMELITPNKGF